MTVSLQCLFKDSWQLCQLRLSSSSLVLCLVSWYRGDNWKSKTSQWNTHCKQFFTKFWTSCLRKQGTRVTFHKLCWLFTRMTKIRYPLDISKTYTHENNRFPSTVKSRGVFSTLSNIYNEAFLWKWLNIFVPSIFFKRAPSKIFINANSILNKLLV